LDILAPANNIALGNGWFPLEIYGDESFRWVSSAAEVYVAAFRNIKHYLQIYLEPGPSLDFKPFELLVTENDEPVARAMIKGRQMISIELPPSEPTIRKLVLHAEGNNKPASKDTRVLNFRVFKLNFVQAIIDILPPGLSAQPGSGWYPLETFNSETFRWASNDAKIEITDRADVKMLLLEIEPGPGDRDCGFNVEAEYFQWLAKFGQLVVARISDAQDATVALGYCVPETYELVFVTLKRRHGIEYRKYGLGNALFFMLFDHIYQQGLLTPLNLRSRLRDVPNVRRHNAIWNPIQMFKPRLEFVNLEARQSVIDRFGGK
jgi:hypothetical protein